MLFNIDNETICFLLIKLLYNNKNIPEIWAIYSKNYTNKTFGYLKKINNSRNFTIFFTLVIKKEGLYTGITKKNIRYSKFSWPSTRYRKLIKSTRDKSNNNKKKIYYTSMINIVLVYPQNLKNIGGQKDTLISVI